MNWNVVEKRIFLQVILDPQKSYMFFINIQDDQRAITKKARTHI